MAKLAIEAENIEKTYRIRQSIDYPSQSFKDLLGNPIRKIRNKSKSSSPSTTLETFYALRGISFKIDHGESVGLIGRNGAGKSTLLKLLSRITRPSNGRILLYEKVTSLLEVGTGFNMELSGRDNIFLNGCFLGLKIKEVEKKFEKIVEFSEIGNFIDTPVKYYSSGMFVRLAFSVAAHLQPETLLLDEVLAVGDVGFFDKSMSKMKELLNSGATIIFVSHNIKAVEEICDRVIWLDHGAIKMDGPSEQVCKEYMEYCKNN
ncbi:MAG: ABC transporter ATP-binding protein [Pelolinea sp.]|jgi:lipopolysaccharide transport system ATP-binding protein|nr:ABC transporter ATP-binding protein [Pelolinea sp.]